MVNQNSTSAISSSLTWDVYLQIINFLVIGDIAPVDCFSTGSLKSFSGHRHDEFTIKRKAIGNEERGCYGESILLPTASICLTLKHKGAEFTSLFDKLGSIISFSAGI